MKDERKVTLITTIWKRRKYLDRFLNAWLAQPNIDEIIVWDNSGEYRPAVLDPRIKIINASYNFGTWVRDMASMLAKNELVIVSDDDVIVEEGLVEEMLGYYTKDMLLGVWGRQFKGQKTYGETGTCNSKTIDIDKLTDVDFVVGLIYMTERKYLFPIDHRDMMWTCYDLHLNGELKKHYPQVRRCLFPTTKWEQTEEETDTSALNRHEDAGKEKQELYERYWLNDKVVA